MIEKHSNKSKGGARQGAGRKKGIANRLTTQAHEKAKAEGIMPLDYLLGVMRNSGDDRMRMAAAMAAAPYLHAKLSSIEVSGVGGGPIIIAATELDAKL